VSAATATNWIGETSGVAVFVREPASEPPVATFSEPLSKAALAAAVGISPRTLDKHLRNDACCAAIGAFKTSSGRNAHWRFPATAPERLCSYLQQTRKVV
jgi:hypothetical protein